jgi:hypothetical protein
MYRNAKGSARNTCRTPRRPWSAAKRSASRCFSHCSLFSAHNEMTEQATVKTHAGKTDSYGPVCVCVCVCVCTYIFRVYVSVYTGSLPRAQEDNGRGKFHRIIRGRPRPFMTRCAFALLTVREQVLQQAHLVGSGCVPGLKKLLQ